MQSTFFNQSSTTEPLAHRLRPRRIEDLVGPITKSAAFMNWLRAGARQSAIFWGPPGTGKTSIAQLASELMDSKGSVIEREFIKLHAFDSGVKELREITKRAKAFPGSIVLFVDEVHSFNKTQQDILLDAIETGSLTFIGATTENPAVSINRALLSRVLKFELKAHRHADLALMLARAEAELSRSLSDEARDYLIKSSYGDARNMLTNLEMIVATYAPSGEIASPSARNDGDEAPVTLSEAKDPQAVTEISLDDIKSLVDRKHFAGDPNTYYDCVSALQKSLRGSDVNASLYWLARLLHGGAELEMVARRILVTASEDVGLADPMALVIANAAYEAALKLGMPEARIPLAQAVAYIARAPKSNASYMAMAQAMNDCTNHPPYEVPDHLRNYSLNSGPVLSSCPSQRAGGEGYIGENPVTKYKYPHDFPGNWVEQQYMPDELLTRKYFKSE
jgi:putative ATPase